MNTRQSPSRATGPGRIPAARGSNLLGLALVVTSLAALLAWVLASVVHLSEQAVVLSVMSIAFAASWSVTNRRPATHRVTLIRVPVRTH